MQEDLEIPNSLEQDLLIEVQNLVEYQDLTYLEAIIFFCEKRNIEIETVVPLILKNIVLKTALEENAEKLHFLKKKQRLPLV